MDDFGGDMDDKEGEGSDDGGDFASVNEFAHILEGSRVSQDEVRKQQTKGKRKSKQKK